MNASIKTKEKKNKVSVSLKHNLDKTMYDVPLTLKTYVPETWSEIAVKQDNQVKNLMPQKDAEGSFVMYQALPNSGQIVLTSN